MGMPNVDLDVYKYMVSDITLVHPMWSNPLVIKSDLISSISILNNYENAIHPQLQLDCVVPYDTYYEILAKAKNVDASFTISYTSVGKQSSIASNVSSGKPTTETTSYTEEWANCKLQVFDTGFLHARDVVDNQLDQSGMKSGSNAENTNFQIKFYLLDSEKLIGYRKNKSFIINGNMNDTIFEMLSSRGMKNIIMSPSSEVEKSDYVVPYGDLGKNLSDLNNTYGIYDYKYLFFMDLNRTYLLNKGELGKDTEYGELGTVNIYIEPYDVKTNSINAGCYKDELKKVYVLGSTDAQIDNIDTLADYAGGGKITSVVGGTKTTMSDKVGYEDIEVSRVIMNKKLHSQYIHELKESKRFLTVSFTNVDLNILTPNKKYMVFANEEFYDKEYDFSGEYRLSTSTILFSRDGNGSFTVNVQLQLLKTN